jgi:hypothetical protein
MEFSGGIEIKMKVHKGGINLGMLSARNPLEVMDRLIYSLRELNVIYKRVNYSFFLGIPFVDKPIRYGV